MRGTENNLFWTYYKNLNPAQKKAVDTIEGPVMVVAGPGTGKTSILTLRIANILKNTDIEPENILALTFTDAAASNMRRRLAEIIGSSAYHVRIHTFHGFCNDVIQSYPEEFPRIVGREPATEVAQLHIIEKLVRKDVIKILCPLGEPNFYVRDILGALGALKREGVTPEAFFRIVKKKRKDAEAEQEKLNQKHKELAILYTAYEEELGKKKLYDWNDMIMETLHTLRTRRPLLRMLQETHQYVLVDEHQDTNNAQNKVLELLLGFHRNPNIFVVGDECQAIFRFQGASLENFLYFKKKYPRATFVTLEHNYRSQSMILDGAGSVMKGKRILKAEKDRAPREIEVYACENEEAEAACVARSVAEKLKNGEKPEEIAILYREHKDARAFGEALWKQGIPYAVESDKNALEERVVESFILLLRAVERLGDDELLGEALHVESLGVSPLHIWKMVETSRREKISLYDILKKEEPKIFGMLESWKRKSIAKPLAKVLEEILEESGLLELALEGARKEEEISALRGFFEEVKRFLESQRNARPKEFLEHIRALETHRVLVRRRGKSRLPRARLMTAHGAKGLEFTHVYITGVYDGHWGGRKRRERLPLPREVFVGRARKEEEEKDGDERRLFYVALTRARKELVITYPKENAAGRELLASRFIGEIDARFKKEKEWEGEVLPSFFPAPKMREQSKKEKEYLRELFHAQGLSVSALNNYLKCPWKYFYVNLIRLPKLPEPHQLFGVAVHAALRDFFLKLKKEEAGEEELLKSFEYHLRRKPISDFEKWRARGEEALRGYARAHKGEWNTHAAFEVGIKGVSEGKVLLNGKLDKLEFLDAGSSVDVVDYKTGTPKTRNEIEGNTKNSTGDIKRQLVFYSILLEGYKNGKYTMNKGVIDFVQPAKNGRYRKEEFEVTDNERKELKGCIRKTADEILSLKFWNTRCADKKCKYCRLRNLLEK